AAVYLAEEMRLIAGQAGQSTDTAESNTQGLDLANFDCFACHHDLKAPSWRELRGHLGKPGRPHMRPWPTALVKLAIHHVADNDNSAKKLPADFDQALKKVTAAFDARPLGDPALIATAASELAQWAEDLAKKVATKPCDEASARLSLSRLATQYKTERVDYD